MVNASQRRDLARYDYKRIHVLLKREGIHINQKRVSPVWPGRLADQG
jgi:hypothetical protein